MATFLAGSVVGEIGLFTGEGRTATVIAETPSVVRRFSRNRLNKLYHERPDPALELTELLAWLLAQRLARTTAQLFAEDHES